MSDFWFEVFWRRVVLKWSSIWTVKLAAVLSSAVKQTQTHSLSLNRTQAMQHGASWCQRMSHIIISAAYTTPKSRHFLNAAPNPWSTQQPKYVWCFCTQARGYLQRRKHPKLIFGNSSVGRTGRLRPTNSCA